MSIRNDLLEKILTATEGGTTLDNRVIVKSPSDLTGPLSSTTEYFIDGIIDMGSQQIEVPQGGLYLAGYNFDVSRLTSSATGYTMFTSPVSGSGNVIGRDYAIEVTGASSKVYDLVSDTGFEAFEFARVNYNNCTSLGEINNYRQGLESGTGRFGGQPQLTLSGTWLGGYIITTSIVRGLVDGSYSIFSAGAGFSMQSRFRTDLNVDLTANSSLLDFNASNFPNPSTLQIQGAIISRNGSFDASDQNITPNITEGELPSAWADSQGISNTYVGGTLAVSVEAETTINTAGTFETVAGTFVSDNLQHFDLPAQNQLRHIGNNPREFYAYFYANVESTANDVLSIKISKFDSSASSFVDVGVQTAQVNSLVGGRDIATFYLFVPVELDVNDYVFMEIANETSTANVTVENGAYLSIIQR